MNKRQLYVEFMRSLEQVDAKDQVGILLDSMFDTLNADQLQEVYDTITEE